MSVSTLICSTMVVVPIHSSLSSSSVGGGVTKVAPRVGGGIGGVWVVIESSSRPQKKATKHHMKTRPRKSQAWDIRRRPTVYPPLPPLPPEWTFVTDDVGAETVVSSPPQPPKTIQSKTSSLSDQEEQISKFSSSDPWLLQVNECNKWKSRERVGMPRSKGTSA